MDSLRQRLVGLLRRTERYTKTDMVYLSSGMFWSIMGQAVGILCAIPLSIAFANLLTQNEFGIYRYILTVAAVVGVFSLTGLPAALARAAARGFEGSLKESFSLNLRWSIPLALIAFIGAGYYGLRDNYVLASGMALIGLFAPFVNIGSLFSSFLNGKKAFRINTAYSNRRTVIHTIVILATLFVFQEPLPVLLAFFGIQAITALYYYRKTLKEEVTNDAQDPEMKRLGKHMSFLNIFATITDKLDALLLFQFVGAAELAIYVFAEMVPDILNRFNKSVASVATPKLVNQERPVGLWRKTALISLALLPATLLYIVLAPFIFDLVFPAYIDAVPFTQALAVLALINITIPSAYIDAQGAVRARYVIAIITNIIKLVAVGAGVLLFGIWGAIAGRFITRIAGAGIIFVILQRWKS